MEMKQNGVDSPSTSTDHIHTTEGRGFFSWFVSIVEELDEMNRVVAFQKICGLQKVKSGPEKVKKKTKTCCTSKDLYVIDRPTLHTFFQLSCYGGEEFLFLLLFPFIMWCIDTWVLRRVSFSFAFCMFLCTSAKDLICKPRPKSPPVLRLESRSADEFSLPSTHAVAITSTFVPLLINCYSRYLNHLPGWALVLFCIMEVFAIISVCLSRIYNGMHTFLDVLCGLICSLLMVTSPITKMDLLFEPSLMTSPLSPFILTFGGLLISSLYPTVKTWNTGRGDSILLIGMHVGFVIGCWFNQYILGMPSDFKVIHSLPHSDISCYVYILKCMAKMLIGLPFVFVIRIVSRFFIFNAICFVFNKNATDHLTKQVPIIELLYKYFSYLVMGFTGVVLTPFVFSFVGVA